MKLYNTLARDKQEFLPLEESKVSLYACGPTVYNFMHIGNARPACVFDTLRRYLEFRGYNVTFVQNFTDVDDKIIKKAGEEGVSSAEIASRYMQEYRTDATGLGIRPATIHPLATETMEEIISMVKTLVEKGIAYEKDGDVYFRARKFAAYGQLSRQSLDDLNAGNRVDVNESKEDPLDFAVWKAAKPGEPYWDSPWGKGRPGWHIECSAMVKKHLGDTIDIHGGGQDLMFPHHENEIAQSTCANDAPYVRFWMHNGFINVDNKKMSKSLGNFFTIRDVAAAYGYEPIKLFLLQSHYRSPINYSTDVIEQCVAAMARLHTSRGNLDTAALLPDEERVGELLEESEAFRALLHRREEEFIAAMDDDLNTAGAIGVLFELAKDCNKYFAKPRFREDAQHAAALFDKLCDVLGLLYTRGGEEDSLDAAIEALIEERQAARKARDFARADALRDELAAKGIVLEDTPQGVKWHRG